MKKLLLAISLCALAIGGSNVSAEARHHSYRFINPAYNGYPAYNAYQAYSGYSGRPGMSPLEWRLRVQLNNTNDPAARQYLTGRIWRAHLYGY